MLRVLMILGALLMALSATALTDQSKALAGFEKACTSAKKKASLCRCISKRLGEKYKNQEIQEEQVEFASQLISGKPLKDEEKPSYFESLSDLIAGFEYQCQSK